MDSRFQTISLHGLHPMVLCVLILCHTAFGNAGASQINEGQARLGPPEQLSTNQVAEQAKPLSPWRITASLGLTFTRGNSETLTISGGIEGKREWNQNEAAFGVTITYGEEKNKVAASSIKGFGQYNRLVSSRLYAMGRTDVLHDDLARLAYRVGLSPGIGYYFLKNSKFTLRTELGPSLIVERLEDQSKHYLTARVGQQFTWQINQRARLWQRLDYSPKMEDFEDFLINAEVGFETAISTHLSLRITAYDTYRSKPAKGKKENDLKLIGGISYTF